MSELSKRIITALVLLVVVWAWYFKLSPVWFMAVLALIGWGATCELILMVRLRGSALYMVSALGLWAAFFMLPNIAWLLIAVLCWFGLFVAVNRAQQPDFPAFFAFVWLFSWLYLFAMAVALTHPFEEGRALIIGSCLAIWVSDSAAYFVGRAFGRRKLCPAVSPGKSVEGLIGALALAIPLAVYWWVDAAVLAWPAAIAVAVVVVVVGVLGDLSESAVKRLVGVKDSGSWLPGHGGVLDRIDAIMMGVPAAWVLWGLLV